ncbi:MAG: hypothetical protein ABIO55_02685 [Ginsengibacter sp.]
MEKVLITGSGAVQNAWDPIIEVIQPPHLDSPINSYQANSLLALLVYNVRLHGSSQNIDIQNRSKEILQDTRPRIASCIKEYQHVGKLPPQREFGFLVEKLIFNQKPHESFKFYHITTNWDTVIHKFLIQFYSQIKTLYLHGSIDDPRTLYLPTEVCVEVYRDKEENAKLTESRDAICSILPDCDELYIYGLSISPLDAELFQILSFCLNQAKIKKILVIDNKCLDVIKQLKIILQRPIDIKGVKPEDIIKLK